MVQIPLYLLLIVILAVAIYIIRLAKRKTGREVSIDLLEGTWLNQWTINGRTNSEICQIQNDGRYFINGTHCFDVTDISYNSITQRISFVKVSVQDPDTRLTNILRIRNENLLEGTENNTIQLLTGVLMRHNPHLLLYIE